MKLIALLYPCLAATTLLTAGEIKLESPATPPRLLELFSSEGCSSCPPAEAWVEAWKDSPELWKTLVPVVFHVDYWDGLGWPDRFAKPAYTQRQRDYSTLWQSESVYTPGFVVNGQEWKGWFHRGELPSGLPATSVHLQAVVAENQSIALTAQGLIPSQKAVLHVAWLGFNLKTNVLAGENGGRLLNHNFVVLDWQNQPATADHQGQMQAGMKLGQLAGEDHPGAVAFWLVDPQGTVLQAGGGWLK